MPPLQRAHLLLLLALLGLCLVRTAPWVQPALPRDGEGSGKGKILLSAEDSCFGVSL